VSEKFANFPSPIQPFADLSPRRWIQTAHRTPRTGTRLELRLNNDLCGFQRATQPKMTSSLNISRFRDLQMTLGHWETLYLAVVTQPGPGLPK